MITRFELKNFTAFNDLAIDFSPKINIIIGENGTGKTQLMKAAYALCAGNNTFSDEGGVDTAKVGAVLASKLVRLFMPMNEQLGKLRRRGVDGNAHLAAHFSQGEEVTLAFHANSKTAKVDKSVRYADYHYAPLFIPTKEVLSLVKGITSPKSDQQTIQSLFDDTYLDLCAKLMRVVSPNTQERLDFDPRFGTIFPDIANAIGGQYELRDGSFCFEQGVYEEERVREQDKLGNKTETKFIPVRDSGISSAMTAEGFRKLGILQLLLANRSLEPGTTGTLFWDEPEANMNPKLIRLLVEILLELARNGQQIVLATHDYVLIKWFDLLMDAGKEDHIQFHVLYSDSASKQIQLESTDNYLKIKPNSIADTFSDLTDHEISSTMGGLGQ